jgi:hypothetical protein
MRHFRSVWPLASVSIYCIILVSISFNPAIAACAENISPHNPCACELKYKSRCAQVDCESNDLDESGDVDCRYRQKYECVYKNDASATAGSDKSVADSHPTYKTAECDAYIFQYEEIAETEVPVPLPEIPSRDDRKEENAKRENVHETYGYQYLLSNGIYGSAALPCMEILNSIEKLLETSQSEGNYRPDELYTGSPYIAEYPPKSTADESLVLFSWHPSELLTFADQDILRKLALAGGKSSGVCRAVLNDYIERLGMKAADLSNRFEETTGLGMPTLAEDLSQTAAFMACFRLVERGELESDEALALLIQSLFHRSQRWNRWIGEVTSDEEYAALPEKRPGDNTTHDTPQDSQDSPGDSVKSAANPVLKAVVLTAAGSLERLGGTICGISRQLKNVY